MSAITSTKPLRQITEVRELLANDQARSQLAAVAAKHMNPERMMRVTANAIRTTPLLQQCEPMSFLGALMQCAALGLEPNTPLGHAYLIPFKNSRKNITEVQLVVGYKGFIDLARRSGQLASIHGDVVYDDDEIWSHEYGSNQHLRHRPGPRSGKMIGAYCYVKLNLGPDITAEGHRFMTIEQIIRHRDTHSQGWKTAVKYGKTADSPWNEKNPAFEAMAIKTAIRAMANRGELPMSIEFMEAMALDEAKPDFAAFAMDPKSGLPPPPDDPDGETIDGEAEPTEQDGAEAQAALEAAEAEAKQRAADEAKVAAEKAAKAKAAAEAKAKAAAAKTEPEKKPEPEKQAAPSVPGEADMRAIYNQVVADLMDGAPFAETLALKRISAALAQMRQHYPGMHADLMAEIEQFRPEAEDTGQVSMNV